MALNLITDRTQADVLRVEALSAKGFANMTDEEKVEWLSTSMKGAYNYTDLNRVNAAMDYLAEKIRSHGNIFELQKMEIPHRRISLLPEGYTQLECIESSGAQYINTEFVPNQDTRTVVDFQYTGETISNNVLFGSRTSSSSNAYAFWPASAGIWRDNYATKSADTGIPSDKERHTLDKNKNVTFIDGVTAYTHNTATFTCPGNMYLLASNDAGTLKYHAVAKIWSCQIYDNGTLVRDYVPCINPNGVCGLYDTVEGKFYGNAGTGSFTGYLPNGLPVGYTELEYIQSSGTQYIDTEYAFLDDFSWEIDFDGFPRGCTLFGGRTSTVRTAVLYQSTVNAACNIAALNASSTPFILGDLSTGRHVVKMSVVANKGSVWLDGIQLYNEQSFSGSYISGVTQAVFAGNNNGTIEGHCSGKVYSLTMWQGTRLVRDYIPVRNPNGEVGLYDKVTETFFGNSGTGAFLAGPPRVVLPDGYTQVEYLESSGTQYIETEFTPNQDTRVVMDFDLVSVSDEGWASLFATRKNTNENAFALFSNQAFTIAYDQYASTAANRSVSLQGRHIVDKNKNVTILDGTTIGTFTYTAFTGDAPMRLFWESSTTPENKYPFIGKLYSCQIYDDETLIHDFVPCKNSAGTAGLYDMVNGVFYTDAAGGTFEVGSVVEWPEVDAEKIRDPYLWYEDDIPTVDLMQNYLDNVRALRGAISMPSNTPSVPADMEDLTVDEANHIEVILSIVEVLLINMSAAWFYSGEIFSGEV